MPSARLCLIGADLSPYTVKVRQYLRYKDVAYEEVLASIRIFKNLVVPKAGVRIMPVLLHGDRIVQDSSLIIDYIEKLYPEPSVCPSTQQQRLVCRLIEFLSDEWFVTMGFGFRFSEEHRNYAVTEIGSTMQPDRSVEKREPMADAFIQGAIVPGMVTQGINKDTMHHFLSMYDYLLDTLSAHFKIHSYLLSDVGPSEGDFALGGLLAAMLYRDPTPSFNMKLKAPHVALYVERMNGWRQQYTGPSRVIDATIDKNGHVELIRSPSAHEMPRWIEHDKIPETLYPVLKPLTDLMHHLKNTQQRLQDYKKRPDAKPLLPRGIGKSKFQILGKTVGSSRSLAPFIQFKWQWITRDVDLKSTTSQQVFQRIDNTGTLAQLVNDCLKQNARIRLERNETNQLQFIQQVIQAKM